jgi:hypothetical protein
MLAVGRKNDIFGPERLIIAFKSPEFHFIPKIISRFYSTAAETSYRLRQNEPFSTFLSQIPQKSGFFS